MPMSCRAPVGATDGVYVAYGLSNYLWWRSFGNEQDDNGVLTLTFEGTGVTAASFAPSHLDDTGVPVPGHRRRQRDRINAEWDEVRDCTDLSAPPPGRYDLAHRHRSPNTRPAFSRRARIPGDIL